MNFSVGSHTCKPRGNVKQGNLESVFVLHINNALSLDYRLKRYRLQKKRLSKNDVNHGWGVHYSYDERRLTKNYNELKSNSISFSKILNGDIVNDLKKK
jgi:hypothetical protein